VSILTLGCQGALFANEVDDTEYSWGKKSFWVKTSSTTIAYFDPKKRPVNHFTWSLTKAENVDITSIFYSRNLNIFKNVNKSTSILHFQKKW
jgi:hypothetical protein